jgi:hypothetical protein
MAMRKSVRFDIAVTLPAVEVKEPKTKASPRYPPKE